MLLVGRVVVGLLLVGRLGVSIGVGLLLVGLSVGLQGHNLEAFDLELLDFELLLELESHESTLHQSHDSDDSSELHEFQLSD